MIVSEWVDVTIQAAAGGDQQMIATVDQIELMTADVGLNVTLHLAVDDAVVVRPLEQANDVLWLCEKSKYSQMMIHARTNWTIGVHLPRLRESRLN